MSYQALARKWRPRLFSEVVGQEHVVQALSNALDHDRVHHAFLFTGTRGVGKTTLARIFAKALNCEKGISSIPCNECANCSAIDGARFVDLIEVDAASRTKVDDTRELLDNVQYAPTQGRYKVYLIDEVHMLSGHSFNALLKTLEEPPPHVKFLLATTDPQKLPVTVLSRCLQFNLKALQPGQISTQLGRILESEGINAEAAALDVLARAADGSLRDALSLLDQALAHGGGAIVDLEVRAMLGSIENKVVEEMIRALGARDAKAVFDVVDSMAEQACDYINALNELLLQLYYLSLRQQLPEALNAKQVEQPWHLELSEKISAEELQLFYQIGLVGKRDISLAPDPRSGFEMVLLRMLAFERTEPEALTVASQNSKPAALMKEASQNVALDTNPDRPRQEATGEVGRRDAKPESTSQNSEVEGAQTSQVSRAHETHGDVWSRLIPRLKINGLVKELAMNVALDEENGDTFQLVLHTNHEHLLDPDREKVLSDAVAEASGRDIKLKIIIGASQGETPAQVLEREQQQRQREAIQAIHDDPNVQAIQDRFDATIIESSIRVRET